MTLRRPPALPPVSRLPDARQLLGWIYAGRIALAAVVALTLAASPAAMALDRSTAIPLLLLITVGFTAASVWRLSDPAAPEREQPGRRFLYAQVVFDALLVTLAVHLTGGRDSVFAPLYILVICAAGLLLPLLGGILVGVLASLFYFAGIALSTSGVLDIAVFLQVALFATVAVATGYLGDRLRQTGTALGEIQTELRLLRLDTDEILTSLNSGVLIVDGEAKLAYINPTAAELISLDPEEWLGKPILAKLNRIAPGMGTVIRRSAETRKPIRRFETREAAEGGTVFGVTTTVMERPTPELPTITAIFADITERKRMDDLRRRSERLEAVAELSASLAHEIKNPLASIRSAVEQLSRNQVGAEDRQVLERLATRESDRLSRLLTEFIDFARVRAEVFVRLELATVLEHAIEVVRAHPDSEERQVRLLLGPEVEDLPVRGDGDLLHRALLNVVLNGVQWAGAGGEVVVEVEAVYSDILSPAQGMSHAVRICISDTGPGIPPEAIDHIFDPFVTHRSGGSGLGLALVQRVVEAHGGAVFVENAKPHEGGGAVFSLYLPAVPKERAVEAQPISEGILP